MVDHKTNFENVSEKSIAIDHLNKVDLAYRKVGRPCTRLFVFYTFFESVTLIYNHTEHGNCSNKTLKISLFLNIFVEKNDTLKCQVLGLRACLTHEMKVFIVI